MQGNGLSVEDAAELARLAGLDVVNYDRERSPAAKRLGIRAAVLDRAVAHARSPSSNSAGQGLPRSAQEAAALVDNAIKPELEIRRSDLPAAAAALRDLFATSEDLFDRDGPVKVVGSAEGNAPGVVPLDRHAVVIEAHRVCRPVMVTAEGERLPVTLPERVANLFLSMRGEHGLRPLDGISAAPLLDADGGLRACEGYETALWCAGIPPVALPERPSLKDAKRALQALRRAFRTFPFADATRQLDPELGVDVVVDKRPRRDESALLTGLLTAVCRPNLPLAPGLMVVAARISGAGSGKGLLVRAISAIAYGVPPRAFTAGRDPHELDKRLTAKLIGADPCLFIDNVNGAVLQSDTLASVLTERPARTRVMRESRMALLNSTAFVAVTGNGLSPGEDLARRFLLMELDARCEDPELRPFPPGFLERIQSRRPELLGAALTIWRYGRQIRPLRRGKPLGSYEQWGEWCRDPLLALGCVDPVERIAEIKAADPDRQRTAELYKAWQGVHGENPVHVRDLADEVKVIADPNNRGRQYLATYLRGLVGTRVERFILERHRSGAKSVPATYTLKSTENRA
jgi:hypothetical protein